MSPRDGGGPLVTVVVGSQRARSCSARLARHIARLLRDPVGVARIETLDLGRTALPLWSEDVGTPAQVRDMLSRSEGFVFVVPEWSGMAPPALKNLFLHCDSTFELADKPGLLVGVSSGSGGAYPLAELRMSSYKNNRVCYLPEQVIVRDVNDLLDGDTFVETPEAKRLEAQLVHALRLFVRYTLALRIVRDSGVRDTVGYPWNM